MGRGDLTEGQWRRIGPLLPAQRPRTGRANKDHRDIINAILWVLRTGAPWRDLPERYGPWSTVASRFYRWRAKGVWQGLLEGLQQEADIVGELAWEFITWMAPSSERINTRLGLKRGGDQALETGPESPGWVEGFRR